MDPGIRVWVSEFSVLFETPTPISVKVAEMAGEMRGLAEEAAAARHQVTSLFPVSSRARSRAL